MMEFKRVRPTSSENFRYPRVAQLIGGNYLYKVQSRRDEREREREGEELKPKFTACRTEPE